MISFEQVNMLASTIATYIAISLSVYAAILKKISLASRSLVNPVLPGQVYPPPAPAPGQPAGAQPGQAPPQGGKL